MVDLLLVPVAVVYLAVVGLLFAYGVNFFYLTLVTWRQRARADPSPPAPPVWPLVTVQLPIYNELYVAERLIEAAARLDYPADRLEIQVLDDSTDETVEVARAAVEGWRARGVAVVHLHRPQRTGYKAGALGVGLASAHGDLLAMFDADFVPPPDFLRRAVPFFQDAGVAFVQARWGHLNRGYSFLTFLQALAIDAHFMVEQFARYRGGYWFNFNGTAGIWRRSAIVDAGGWRADTLTEDLDLSYRASLRGWRAIYRRDLVVPAEVPPTMSAYRRQQHRWARGSLECALKLLPPVWAAPVPLSRKLEATLHLTGYAVHLLLFALAVLYPLVLLLSQRYANLVTLFGIAPLFNATAFAPTVFFVVAQQQLGRRWWRLLPVLLFISAFGSGMMVNTVRAASQVLRGGPAVFERTPKFALLHRRERWQQRRYQLGLDRIVFVEVGLALLNALTVVLAIQTGNWSIAVYATMFGTGLLFTAGLTIAQVLSLRRRTRPAAAAAPNA